MKRGALSTPARCGLVWLVLGALSGLAQPISASAQELDNTGGLPEVFSLLEGAWDGTGVLLDRPAEFTMEWRIGPDGFARLSFSNAWVDESGNTTPILRSVAIYLVQGSIAEGVWIDDRPQRIRLDAMVSDSSLVTNWTADEERGRTEYVVHASDEIVVLDFVEVDGEERPFAEAQYRKRTP